MQRRELRRISVRAVALLGVWLVAAACGGTGKNATSSSGRRPAPSSPPSSVPVALGVAQRVSVANAFGPGSQDVPATITVFSVRDNVAPPPAPQPAAADSHWASAEVEFCRQRPVRLGYPAWVLGDDSGRTAEVAKVLHRRFPRPAFSNASTAVGCTRGWVTWVTPNNLIPTKVTFEQTQDVPGAWRIRR